MLDTSPLAEPLKRAVFEKPEPDHISPKLADGLKGFFNRLTYAEFTLANHFAAAQNILREHALIGQRKTMVEPVVSEDGTIRLTAALRGAGKSDLAIKARSAHNNAQFHAREKLKILSIFWNNADRFRPVMASIAPTIQTVYGVNTLKYSDKKFLLGDMRQLASSVFGMMRTLEPFFSRGDLPNNTQSFDRAFIESLLKDTDLSPDDILDAAKTDGAQSRIHVSDSVSQSATVIPFRPR